MVFSVFAGAGGEPAGLWSDGMIRTTRIWGLSARLVMFTVALGLTTAHAEDAPDIDAGAYQRPPYTVNPGDVLSISVWKEADLQRGVIVRPDGVFSFPLAGEIQAEGKSIPEIQALLTERLERFIPDPVITIATESVAGHNVYVIGQVNRPGQFNASATVDVAQALSIAGGTTTFAKLDDIKILRRNKKGALIAIPFDYGDIEKGKRLDQNILLEPGDVVVVP
jgi:polysaccharide export outer membrane protein